MAIVELLAREPGGLSLGEIATSLSIPPSATHRLLTELVGLGHLRQLGDQGRYALDMKLVSLSLGFLSHVDLVELAKPGIDRLAAESQALARLGIIDGDALTWVLKSQGSRSNIRYDPPMNYRVQLSASASGQAWLAQLTDDEALQLVARQGIATAGFGPAAPRTAEEVMTAVRRTRSRGYALVVDSYERNVTAVAVAIVNSELGRVTGVLSIAGPNFDMEPSHVEALVPALREEAQRLSSARLDYVKYLLPVPRSA